MSQSDYLQHKKLSVSIKDLAKNRPVLESQTYTNFRKYTLESTITNTLPIIHQLVAPNNSIVFDMERNIHSCPINQFTLCSRTDTRSNRVKNSPYTCRKGNLTYCNIKTVI